MIFKGATTTTGVGADAGATKSDERNNEVTFKNCAAYTDCIGGINKMQVDNSKDFNVVIPMYNIIEYSEN